MARSRLPREFGFTGVRRAINNWLRRNTSLVAVDIGSSCIKVVEAEAGAERAEIVRAISFATPAASVASCSVRDTAAVAQALRHHLRAAKIRSTRAVTCIPCPAAVLKRFRVPLADADRLDVLVRAEVENLASFGSETLSVDHHVSEAATEEALDVLVVAARREVVRGYVAALDGAGLRTGAVDVDALVIANAIDSVGDVDPARTLAFVHVGAEISTLGIQSHGTWVFTGSIGVGLGPTIAGAEAAADSLLEDARREACVPIGREVESALRFYWPESAGDRVDDVVLSGGGATVPALATLLAQSLGCTVRVLHPFASRRLSAAADGLETASAAAPFAVCAGLALRSLEEP